MWWWRWWASEFGVRSSDLLPRVSISLFLLFHRRSPRYYFSYTFTTKLVWNLQSLWMCMCFSLAHKSKKPTKGVDNNPKTYSKVWYYSQPSLFPMSEPLTQAEKNLQADGEAFPFFKFVLTGGRKLLLLFFLIKAFLRLNLFCQHQSWRIFNLLRISHSMCRKDNGIGQNLLIPQRAWVWSHYVSSCFFRIFFFLNHTVQRRKSIHKLSFSLSPTNIYPPHRCPEAFTLLASNGLSLDFVSENCVLTLHVRKNKLTCCF